MTIPDPDNVDFTGELTGFDPAAQSIFKDSATASAANGHIQRALDGTSAATYANSMRQAQYRQQAQNIADANLLARKTGLIGQLAQANMQNYSLHLQTSLEIAKTTEEIGNRGIEMAIAVSGAENQHDQTEWSRRVEIASYSLKQFATLIDIKEGAIDNTWRKGMERFNALMRVKDFSQAATVFTETTGDPIAMDKLLNAMTIDELEKTIEDAIALTNSGAVSSDAAKAFGILAAKCSKKKNELLAQGNIPAGDWQNYTDALTGGVAVTDEDESQNASLYNVGLVKNTPAWQDFIAREYKKGAESLFWSGAIPVSGSPEAMRTIFDRVTLQGEIAYALWNQGRGVLNGTTRQLLMDYDLYQPDLDLASEEQKLEWRDRMDKITQFLTDEQDAFAEKWWTDGGEEFQQKYDFVTHFLKYYLTTGINQAGEIRFPEYLLKVAAKLDMQGEPIVRDDLGNGDFTFEPDYKAVITYDLEDTMQWGTDDQFETWYESSNRYAKGALGRQYLDPNIGKVIWITQNAIDNAHEQVGNIKLGMVLLKDYEEGTSYPHATLLYLRNELESCKFRRRA